MRSALKIALLSFSLSLEMVYATQKGMTNGVPDTELQDGMNCWAFAAANAAGILDNRHSEIKHADFIDEAANGFVTKDGGDPEMAAKGLKKMGLQTKITSDQEEAEKAIAEGHPVEIFKNSHAWTNVKGADGRTVRVDSGEGQNRVLEDSEFKEDMSGADSYLIVKKPPPPPPPPGQGDPPQADSSSNRHASSDTLAKETSRFSETTSLKPTPFVLDGLFAPIRTWVALPANPDSSGTVKKTIQEKNVRIQSTNGGSETTLASNEIAKSPFKGPTARSRVQLARHLIAQLPSSVPSSSPLNKTTANLKRRMGTLF